MGKACKPLALIGGAICIDVGAMAVWDRRGGEGGRHGRLTEGATGRVFGNEAEGAVLRLLHWAMKMGGVGQVGVGSEADVGI